MAVNESNEEKKNMTKGNESTMSDASEKKNVDAMHALERLANDCVDANEMK